jgi:pimeloyl-ACP methyl ester carboxylesterase
MTTATRAREDTISLGGIAIHQAVLGEGDPVVLVHGWGANLGLMMPLAERLAGLGYCCHVPEMPGHGQSGLPPTAWSVHDYARLVAQYLDHHRLDAVLLFGHSFGGRLGLVLGAHYGDRVRKLALADSAGVRPRPSTVGQLRLKGYRVALNMLKGIGLSSQAERLRGWYTNRYGSADYKAASGVMRETFVKVVNEDLLPLAARIQIPTLLLWGDQDRDTPLWQGQMLEKTIPDAGLVVWEGAGHYSYLDRLADTVHVLNHFFR